MKKVLFFVSGFEDGDIDDERLIRELQAAYLYNTQEEAIKDDEDEFSPEDIESFRHFKVTIEEIPNPKRKANAPLN